MQKKVRDEDWGINKSIRMRCRMLSTINLFSSNSKLTNWRLCDIDVANNAVNINNRARISLLSHLICKRRWRINEQAEEVQTKWNFNACFVFTESYSHLCEFSFWFFALQIAICWKTTGTKSTVHLLNDKCLCPLVSLNCQHIFIWCDNFFIVPSASFRSFNFQTKSKTKNNFPCKLREMDFSFYLLSCVKTFS